MTVEGFPERKMDVVANVREGRAALQYSGVDGIYTSEGKLFLVQSKWKAVNDRPTPPAEAQVPLEMVSVVVEEFYETAGERPTSIDWQHV
ncbi:Imm1 family immunity protein [Glycomyces algeriensis]|uniref:Uncharacterized protein n=1 Tax=Glycomyces algeriensis TaxID=256037 RepID=A0A9W6LHL1_9ACTN|nr:Imm1 family immunity protein [Glycomyces algeriensis]MDA1364662.1 Imm1 family immunity protein [Glycomyces algeriensis]MDR7350701.1 hypothetical protein [Glycomyces algeriensis]GLI43410.1 hypothetical protein GALLR39Z86_32600 [Glycomyces algeriensis]